MEYKWTKTHRIYKTYTTDKIKSIVKQAEAKGYNFWHGDDYIPKFDENGIDEYLWLPTICEFFVSGIINDQLRRQKQNPKFPQDLKCVVLNGTAHDLEITNYAHIRTVEVKSSPLRNHNLQEQSDFGKHAKFEQILGLQSSTINHGGVEQMTDLAAKVIWVYDRDKKTIKLYAGYFLVIGSEYTKTYESEIPMHEATLGFTKTNKHFLKDVRLFRTQTMMNLIKNIEMEYNRYYE